MSLALVAPTGKFRIIRMDTVDHAHYFVRDCNTRSEAFEIVDNHNGDRRNESQDTYCVYDDVGTCIRNAEASPINF